MDAHSKISSLKKELLSKAEIAVNEGDIKLLGIYTQRLQQLESLRNNLEKIEVTLSHIEEKINSSKNIDEPNSVDITNSLKGEREDTLSFKQRSENHRKLFLQECHLKGIKLSPHKGRRIYRKNDNDFVGITFAIEKPNGWFLGLELEDYEAVVLLCKKGRDILRFIIPSSFYTAFLEYYSRSGNELKFHITTQQGEYYMRIPQIGNKNITEYLDNFTCLLSSH